MQKELTVKHALLNSLLPNQETMLQMNWLITSGIFTQEGVIDNVTALLKASQHQGKTYQHRTYLL